jgi:hypothetical protein
MKLELKHLAGYLPYGLNCVKGIVRTKITAVSLDSKFLFVNRYLGSREKDMISIEDIKPILRPLSDLTKEIDVNGDKFVPSTLGLNLPLENLISEEILKLKYNTVQKLLEWHFDIYGLIEKGLAIDINTLK